MAQQYDKYGIPPSLDDDRVIVIRYRNDSIFLFQVYLSYGNHFIDMLKEFQIGYKNPFYLLRKGNGCVNRRF